MNAHEFIAGQPWAIRAEALTGLLAFADRNPEAVRQAFAQLPKPEPDAVRSKTGNQLDGTMGRVEIRDGVACIAVRGVMSRYASMFTDVCGGTSYQRLATDLQSAVDNPNVRSVLLEIDSPGGTAIGAGELAGLIRTLSARKPIVGYVGGLGCSAGYYLAASCSELVCHPSAMLGSIGCVLQIDNRKPKGEVTIVSSQSPLKRADPETEEGRDALQKEVDDLAQVFIDDVAGFRGVSSEYVSQHFGKGGCFLGKEAVAQGMADGLGTFEDTLARMCRGESLPKRPMTEPAKGKTQPRTEERTTMKWNPFALLGKVYEDNPEAVEKAFSEGEGRDSFEARLAATLKAAEAPAVPTATIDVEAIARDKAEKIASEKASATIAKFYAEQAGNFFLNQVKAGTVLPADVPTLTALYIDFATLDHDSPMAVKDSAGVETPVSRLGFLTGRIESAKGQKFTEEKIPADASQMPHSLAGMKILPTAAAASPDEADREAKIREMLKYTPEGRAYLAELNTK